MLCVCLQTSSLKFNVISLKYCLFQQQYIVLVLFVSIVIKHVAKCGLFKCNHILILFVYTNNCHVLHLISLNVWLSVSVEPTNCGTQRSQIQSQVRQGVLSLPFFLKLCFFYQTFFCVNKGISHGGSLSILKQESYHDVLNRDMKQSALVKITTCAWWLRPVNV